MNQRPAPLVIRDWAELPLYVDVVTVAAIYGKSTRAIDRLVRLGRSKDIPMPALTRPMRWSRADLQRHWERGHFATGLRRPA